MKLRKEVVMAYFKVLTRMGEICSTRRGGKHIEIFSQKAGSLGIYRHKYLHNLERNVRKRDR
jgi:hypothetical protein